MFFRKKCGIDLGSDTIKIADKKNKKVVCEKNMIAVRDKTYVIAVGQRAYEMYEKTPLCVTADSPMIDGAIADGGNLGFILARLLKRFSSVFTKRPDILVTVPMELSEIEMRAFYKSLLWKKELQMRSASVCRFLPRREVWWSTSELPQPGFL